LTPRELDIVRRVVTGDRVRAIAERLFLSQSTVRNHLSSVYRKLGLRSQQELVDRFRVTELGPMDGESG
jgi:DNA-binding CsgD family transcriptional regulator